MILPTQPAYETLDRPGYGGGDVEELKKSIEQNGFDSAAYIETFEYDGRLYMIDGHHRLYALTETGGTSIPYYNNDMSDREATWRSQEMDLSKLAGYKSCFKKRDKNGNLVVDDFSYEDIYPGIIEIAEENLCRDPRFSQWKRMLMESGREAEYIEYIQKLKRLCGINCEGKKIEDDGDERE